MDLESGLFRGDARPHNNAPQVIETSGVEVVDVAADVRCVVPVNTSGSAALVAECLGERKRPLVPFASTLRHIA